MIERISVRTMVYAVSVEIGSTVNWLIPEIERFMCSKTELNAVKRYTRSGLPHSSTLTISNGTHFLAGLVRSAVKCRSLLYVIEFGGVIAKAYPTECLLSLLLKVGLNADIRLDGRQATACRSLKLRAVCAAAPDGKHRIVSVALLPIRIVGGLVA